MLVAYTVPFLPTRYSDTDYLFNLSLLYLGDYTNHAFPARWGFTISAAAALVKALRVWLTE